MSVTVLLPGGNAVVHEDANEAETRYGVLVVLKREHHSRTGLAYYPDRIRTIMVYAAGEWRTARPE